VREKAKVRGQQRKKIPGGRLKRKVLLLMDPHGVEKAKGSCWGN